MFDAFLPRLMNIRIEEKILLRLRELFCCFWIAKINNHKPTLSNLFSLYFKFLTVTNLIIDLLPKLSTNISYLRAVTCFVHLTILHCII